MATRVAVTTGAPANANAFSPTLPTHQSGDRLTLFVVGKVDSTTIPTIDQGWTLVGSGTGGTGLNLADQGTVFAAVYAKDATSSSETAPTVTPGGTAPNSWEWVCASHRPDTGKAWADTITASAAWVGFASDTNTASALTGSAATSFAAAGDAVFVVGNIPTDGGSALTAGATLTATGLSGGTLSNATSQYVENNLGTDSAAVWVGWTGFTGTQSANLTASLTITGSGNHSGVITFAVLREQTVASGTFATTLDGSTLAATAAETIAGTLATTLAGASLAGSGTVAVPVDGTLAATLAGATLAAAGTETITGTAASTLAGATLAASGTETITGTAASTLAGAALAAAGIQTVPGTLAVTLDGVTLTGAGAETIAGTLAATLGGATLAATGTVLSGITGTLTATLDGATLTGAGVETVPGSLATTLDGATFTADGTVLAGVTGALAATLSGVTLAASGTHAVAVDDLDPLRLTFNETARVTVADPSPRTTTSESIRISVQE